MNHERIRNKSRAQALLDARDLEGALELLESALEAREEVELRMMHAHAHALAGDYRAAMASVERVDTTKIDPVQYRYKLGRYAMRAGDYERAIDVFTDLLRLADDRATAYFGGAVLLCRAFCALQCGDKSAALRDAFASNVRDPIRVSGGLLSREDIISAVKR